MLASAKDPATARISEKKEDNSVSASSVQEAVEGPLGCRKEFPLLIKGLI